MNVLSYSVPSLQKQLSDRRLPLQFILRITKHVLKGLEYLHDECQIIHSGMSSSFRLVTRRCNYLTDLKPGNILVSPSDIESVVTHEVLQYPGTLYTFPKTIPPEELPCLPVLSTPLIFAVDKNRDAELHWVIADLGHGELIRRYLGKLLL
jgi:serine/threonine-protein kinase SRPK3